MESVRPLEDSLKGTGDEASDSFIGGAPEDLEETFDAEEDETYTPERDITNAANHIERMIVMLRSDGLTFAGNKHLRFERLDPIGSEFLHADGETIPKEGKEPRRVAVVIGPEHGAVSNFQVKTAVIGGHPSTEWALGLDTMSHRPTSEFLALQKKHTRED